jgi:hypothetical protein
MDEWISREWEDDATTWQELLPILFPADKDGVCPFPGCYIRFFYLEDMARHLLTRKSYSFLLCRPS